MANRPEAFFLASDFPGTDALDGGQRFCIYHPPALVSVNEPVRGLVLYVHPFAEEMNKSRRMAA